jgi:hypothetical protein
MARSAQNGNSTSTQLKKLMASINQSGKSVTSTIALMQLNEKTENLINSSTLTNEEVGAWFSQVVECVKALGVQPHQLAVWLGTDLAEAIAEQV